jgi:putative flippase GtrA
MVGGVLGVPIRKLLRYASVSAVSTAAGLTVLGVSVGLLHVPAGWANVAATAVGTVPSFELNRRWVWGRGGRRSVTAEVAPFVALSFVGLALSTLAVHVAGAWADSRGWSSPARTALVMATNLATYGSLWVLQFLLLDRVLFRRPKASIHVADSYRTLGSPPGDRLAG